jgi:hypothetical protein
VINEAPKQFTYVLTACFLQLFIALCLAICRSEYSDQ